MSVRVGAFLRRDDGGLGAESREFARWMKPDKILAIRGEWNDHPERFSGYNTTYVDGIPTHSELDIFLRDIDILFSIESFYNWGAIPMAKQRGIKTVLRVNMEMNLNNVEPDLPIADWFIVPSLWNYDKIPFTNKSYLPWPVNREVLPFKQRSKIESFYFIGGHPAYEDRGGREIFNQALQYINAPVKIVDQMVFNYENYWDIHQFGDCLIHPRRYGGQSLILNEALSCGIPVIMPDISPQNAFLHPDMLVPSSGGHFISVQGGIIERYDVEPQVLADRVNSLYTTDISGLSEWANQYADTISWPVLKPKYDQLFKELCEA